MNMNSLMKIEKSLKLNIFRKKLKKGLYLHFLENLIVCPGSVVVYHPSLSSSGLGFKFRPGRSIFKKL